jgi:hypothetical protein
MNEHGEIYTWLSFTSYILQLGGGGRLKAKGHQSVFNNRLKSDVPNSRESRTYMKHEYSSEWCNIVRGIQFFLK